MIVASRLTYGLVLLFLIPSLLLAGVKESVSHSAMLDLIISNDHWFDHGSYEENDSIGEAKKTLHRAMYYFSYGDKYSQASAEFWGSIDSSLSLPRAICTDYTGEGAFGIFSLPIFYAVGAPFATVGAIGGAISSSIVLADQSLFEGNRKQSLKEDFASAFQMLYDSFAIEYLRFKTSRSKHLPLIFCHFKFEPRTKLSPLLNSDASDEEFSAAKDKIKERIQKDHFLVSDYPIDESVIEKLTAKLKVNSSLTDQENSEVILVMLYRLIRGIYHNQDFGFLPFVHTWPESSAREFLVFFANDGSITD